MKQLFAAVTNPMMGRWYRALKLRLQALWYTEMLHSSMAGMQRTYDKCVGTPLINLYNPNAHNRLREAYVTASYFYHQGRYDESLVHSRRAYREHITG